MRRALAEVPPVHVQPEHRRDVAELGIDLAPGQHRPMAVTPQDGHEEPQAVLALGGIEVRLRGL